MFTLTVLVWLVAVLTLILFWQELGERYDLPRVSQKQLFAVLFLPPTLLGFAIHFDLFSFNNPDFLLIIVGLCFIGYSSAGALLFKIVNSRDAASEHMKNNNNKINVFLMIAKIILELISLISAVLGIYSFYSEYF